MTLPERSPKSARTRVDLRRSAQEMALVPRLGGGPCCGAHSSSASKELEELPHDGGGCVFGREMPSVRNQAKLSTRNDGSKALGDGAVEPPVLLAPHDPHRHVDARKERLESADVVVRPLRDLA